MRFMCLPVRTEQGTYIKNRIAHRRAREISVPSCKYSDPAPSRWILGVQQRLVRRALLPPSGHTENSIKRK